MKATRASSSNPVFSGVRVFLGISGPDYGGVLIYRVGVFWYEPLSCNTVCSLMSRVNRIGSDFMR